MWFCFLVKNSGNADVLCSSGPLEETQCLTPNACKLVIKHPSPLPVQVQAVVWELHGFMSVRAEIKMDHADLYMLTLGLSSVLLRVYSTSVCCVNTSGSLQYCRRLREEVKEVHRMDLGFKNRTKLRFCGVSELINTDSVGAFMCHC